MSEKQKLGEEAKRNLMIIGGVMTVAILFSVWFIGNMGQKATLAAAVKSEVPELNTRVEDRAAGETPINSDQLADLNKERDAQAAADAARSGQTYIPDLISSPKEEIKQEPEPPAPTYDATGTQPPPPPPAMDLPAKPDGSITAINLINQINNDSRMVPSVSGTTLKAPPPSYMPPQSQSTQTKSPTFVCPIGEQCNDRGEILLKRAGDRLFVELELSIHTDIKSPVFGKILSGHPSLRGRQIIGSFTQNANLSVGITFNKVAMLGGTVPINAIVVDPNNGRAALSGKIDHKWMERFGLPIIAAGAGKYADLVSQQGTSVATGVGTTVQTSTLSNAQIQDAAIAEGVKRIGTTLDATAAAAKPSTELPNHIGVQVRLIDDLWGKPE